MKYKNKRLTMHENDIKGATKMMKRLFTWTALCTMVIGLFLVTTNIQHVEAAKSTSEGINEKLGVPIIVYGDTLTAEQKEKVKEMLEVDSLEDPKEFTVTGADIAHYIDGDPHSRMFSSAKIIREEQGEGLTIHIVDAENITKVTTDMYKNALLTAGVEDATVTVASPVKVSGHSALTGIYKAYDVEGVELDKERMELANEELDVATDLAEEDGVSNEDVTNLLTEIKKMFAENKPLTREEVEKIVKEQVDKLNIKLDEDAIQRLVDLFDKIRDSNIDFDKVKGQLEDIASTIKEKLKDLDLDDSFWEKVENFFRDILNWIKSLFN